MRKFLRSCSILTHKNQIDNFLTKLCAEKRKKKQHWGSGTLRWGLTLGSTEKPNPLNRCAQISGNEGRGRQHFNKLMSKQLNVIAWIMNASHESLLFPWIIPPNVIAREQHPFCPHPPQSMLFLFLFFFWCHFLPSMYRDFEFVDHSLCFSPSIHRMHPGFQSGSGETVTSWDPPPKWVPVSQQNPNQIPSSGPSTGFWFLSRPICFFNFEEITVLSFIPQHHHHT